MRTVSWTLCEPEMCQWFAMASATRKDQEATSGLAFSSANVQTGANLRRLARR